VNFGTPVEAQGHVSTSSTKPNNRPTNYRDEWIGIEYAAASRRPYCWRPPSLGIEGWEWFGIIRVARRLVARNAAADVDGRRWQARPPDFARDERCVHFGLSG